MIVDLANNKAGKDLGTVIYRICNAGGTYYIGSTTNLYHRKVLHKSQAKLKQGRQQKLFDFINKVGFENLTFDILEFASPETRYHLEQKWINYYTDLGSNLLNFLSPLKTPFSERNKAQAVVTTDVDTGEITVYESQLGAAKSLGMAHSLFRHYLITGGVCPKVNCTFSVADKGVFGGLS